MTNDVLAQPRSPSSLATHVQQLEVATKNHIWFPRPDVGACLTTVIYELVVNTAFSDTNGVLAGFRVLL